MHLEHLRKFATKRQLECLDAWDECGTQAKAAKSLGIGKRRIESNIQALKARAAMQGVAPEFDMTREVPEPYRLKGTSTLYDRDGQPVQQWVKTNIDHDRAMEVMREACEAMSQDIKPQKPIKMPRVTDSDLCNMYTLSDVHLGMLASKRENMTGNWDLKIAEETIIDTFGRMMHSSEDSQSCIINQLGDFLQSDSIFPATPTSHNVVDVDGRFGRTVEACIRILRTIVDMALRKHKNVKLLVAEGNHDITSSIWMRRMFVALYEKEGRIEVIDSDMPYYATQFGCNMLAAHHGHLKKPSDLPIFFASMFPELWGRTQMRYVHTGHLHHGKELEHPGMQHIQHPTLTAADTHTSRHAYLSVRRVLSHTYHKKIGEVGRITTYPKIYI